VQKWFRLALIVVAVVAALEWWSPGNAPGEPGGPPAPDVRTAPERPSSEYPAFLPSEAVATLDLIARGGPYPYERDGTVFQNREQRLPAQPRGYYREYTVPTPGSRDRGARRIVTGGDPPEVFYYTDDHYRSFREVQVPQ
jgi:guanyl-specific ribonuclease Sa